ncbi:MAG: hypothetical protein ACRBFS_18205 [Aureispira sp.]
MTIENSISKKNNSLLVLSKNLSPSKEGAYLVNNFCGQVLYEYSALQKRSSQNIYVCGNLQELQQLDQPFYIIQELSSNYTPLPSNGQLVKLGQVPVVIHNAGVYFRHFFEGENYFEQIQEEHVFQALTESTKPTKALRKGIYLTDVSKETINHQEEALHYRLLRCSSNLTGPTDNFRATDRQIITALNEAASATFKHPTALNHVLAQIYTNIKRPDSNKEKKAKIKAHSDKTKDMPIEGLIAFCTFYDSTNFDQLQPSKTDAYDWCYKKNSGLTRLHFKLKNTVEDEDWVKEFSVTLYPNSVFLIPLSTNRLYTHAIKPSLLNVDRIPTRMGYVVRCSNQEAVFMQEQTYLKENGDLIPLEPMTSDTMTELRHSYYQENAMEKKVQYKKVHFSMNTGDYQKPIY